MGQKSGLLPEGDVRLTANIRADLHMKLKMRSVERRTTFGDQFEAVDAVQEAVTHVDGLVLASQADPVEQLPDDAPS